MITKRLVILERGKCMTQRIRSKIRTKVARSIPTRSHGRNLDKQSFVMGFMNGALRLVRVGALQ